MSVQTPQTVGSLFGRIFDDNLPVAKKREIVIQFMRDNLPKETEIREDKIQTLFDQAVIHSLSNNYKRVAPKEESFFSGIIEAVQKAISSPSSSSPSDDYVLVNGDATTEPENPVTELSSADKKLLEYIRQHILPGKK
jgi:hypothetical protein